MILYILRHGETEWNKKKRMQGQRDIPLASEGVRLARLTGEGMARQGKRIDLVISSPLTRAVETARLVTEGRDIPIHTDARLMEISFGEWEGECILDSPILPREFQEQFYHDPMHCMRPPKGETFQEVCERTRQFYEALVQEAEYQDRYILLSTHGCAGRCLLANFYEDKNDIWRGGVPPNCAITTVEITGEGTYVRRKDEIFY